MCPPAGTIRQTIRRPCAGGWMCTGCSRTSSYRAKENPGGSRRAFLPELQIQRAASHAVVVGTTAAFGNDPVDNLIGIGNVAGLAVNAICGIDFQFQAAS